MTWSLALQNGDLAINNSSISVVTGQDKMFQDLECFFLTPLGYDKNNPNYGSILLGGQDVSGDAYEPITSDLNDGATASEFSTEIQRVLLAYQNMQLARAKQDQTAYGLTTLSRGEVLLTVNEIDITQIQVNANINISVTSANGSDLNVTVPVSGSR